MKNFTKKFVSALLVICVFSMFSFALVSAAENMDAEFVSDTIPTTMVRGETYQVSITMKNIGIVNEWRKSHNVRLGTHENNVIAWTAGIMPEVGNRVELSADTDTNPVNIGDEYTFSFSVTAPATGDSVVLAAQMVQDGRAWFGPIILRTITLTDEAETAAPTTAPTNAPIVETPGDSLSITLMLIIMIMISMSGVILVSKKSAIK